MSDREMEFRAEQVAEEIQGTCRELNEFASEAEQENHTFLEALDNIVFCCALCGWWCETGEMSSNEVEETCIECEEEE